MIQQPKILLIYTGGTVGMMHDPESGLLIPLNFEHLSAQLPELKQFDFSIQVHSFAKPIDSSNMTPEIWKELAQIIYNRYNEFDGFVILHGSDTMAYTASALSFMLENLAKPVILTGSQLPIGMIRTDGKENIISAIEIAAAKNEKGEPMVPEAAIYFEYRLLRGNRARKISANNFNAFHSGNYPVLAEAGVNIKYNQSAIRNLPKEKLKLNDSLNNNVIILKVFPGMNANYLNGILKIENLKAIVLETYGSGNATTDKLFIDFIKQAIKKEIIIVNTTQCVSGSVVMGKYETSALLQNAGVIGAGDMTTEATVVKLMLLLAQNSSNEELKSRFIENMSGEISSNLTN